MHNSPSGQYTLPGTAPSTQRVVAGVSRSASDRPPRGGTSSPSSGLDHLLREALDRLADTDQRISQLEAESTCYRDNVLPTNAERLTLTSFVTKGPSGHLDREPAEGQSVRHISPSEFGLPER
jgi:hypothetical protein